MEGDRSAEPAPETAEVLLAALRRLEGEGRLSLRIEPALLTHIDSPVASEADGNIWVYGFLALAAALWLWRGAVPGLLVLAAGILVYFTLGRAYMHRRIERRVRQNALGNLETWRRLWRFRGLTLSASGRPGPADCASPDGNWMAFVRALR
jgi:fatty acid desaturase